MRGVYGSMQMVSTRRESTAVRAGPADGPWSLERLWTESAGTAVHYFHGDQSPDHPVITQVRAALPNV